MSPSTEVRENREFAAELKFVVPHAVGMQIREWARNELVADPNATGESGDTYKITSLYFDTNLFDVFQRNGSYGRSKYRIRRYGASETVFLERKLKTRGLVSKRRSVVKTEELERLNHVGPQRGWGGFWYHQRLAARRLRPTCQIAYHRTARVLMTNTGPIRLTIDEDIRALPACGLAFNDSTPGTLLSENQAIIELKYRVETPLLFKRLIEEFTLNSRSVSKYRLAMTALGLVSSAALNSPTNGELNSLYA